MNAKCESISIRRDDDLQGLFIYAVAVLEFEQDGTTLVQELKSGGLGNVEGDEAYFTLVGEEQRAELVEMLETLGLGDPDYANGYPTEDAPALDRLATMVHDLHAKFELPADCYEQLSEAIMATGRTVGLEEAGAMNTSDGLGG